MPKKAVKVPSKVDSLLEKAAKQAAEQLEQKRVAKELRNEKRAEHKALLRGSSENRKYVTKIPGAVIDVRWHNGIQQVSIDYGNSDVDEATEEVEEPKVNLPSVKMTWKKLRQEVLAGCTVYTKSNKKIPCTKRAEVFPNKEVKVTVENIGKTKIYRLL